MYAFGNLKKDVCFSIAVSPERRCVPFLGNIKVTATGLPFHVMFVPFLPGKIKAKSIKVLGYFLRDVFGNFVSLMVE